MTRALTAAPALLTLLACGSCTSDDPLDEGPLACVDIMLEGALPIEVNAVETRDEGDDYTPDNHVGVDGDFEDLIYAWTAETAGDYQIAFQVTDPAEQLTRKRYTLEGPCGSDPSGSGVGGTTDMISLDAGETVVFVVENCAADCNITIDVFTELPDLP